MRDAIRWFKCKLKPPKNGLRRARVPRAPRSATALHFLQRTIPGREGASMLTYFFGRKLHENERIWTPGARVPAPHLDLPLTSMHKGVSL